jgi:redox-sensitive bicupin YhaK (pirin superfamily)
MLKKVTHLISAENVNMGGIILKQALPTNNINQVDPFLLLHHGKFKFNKNAQAIHQGMGPHPHRGFSPVSFVIEGEIHHRDSRGNDQIAKKGEVQWMHAGAGIIHSERPSQKLVNTGGTQEVIQLWINSPAAKKKDEPKYQFSNEKEISVFQSGDKKFSNKLIAGSYKGLQSKIDSESELLIIWSSADRGGNQTLTIPKEMNTMVYVIQGELNLKGYGSVKKETLTVFDNHETDIEMNAVSDTQFLLLAGAPINEKVTQQGPYVMNTTTEIMEAMRDYQMGKMGILIE